MSVVLLCRGPQVVFCQASVLSQLPVAVSRKRVYDAACVYVASDRSQHMV